MADAIAREVFGLLYETSTEAVFVVDQASREIVSANLRAADMLAVEPEVLTKMVLGSICADPTRDVSSPGHYEDVELRRCDGYPVYVELNVAHVHVASRGSLLAYTARDTSERRLLQNELLAKHAALYEAMRELELRNREIALLGWRAAMGELVAGFAHHLNNPVGALASTLRRMTKVIANVPDDTRGELERLVTRASAIGRRIESNVAAIVQASRTNAGDPPGPRELPPELARVLSMFVEQLEEIPMKEPS